MRPGQSARVVTEASHRAIEAAAAEHEPAMMRAVERVLRAMVREVVQSFEGGTRLVLVSAAAEEWVPPEYHVPIASSLADVDATNEKLERITQKYRSLITSDTGHAFGSDIGIVFDQRNRLLDGVIASQSGMRITTAPESVVRPMMQSLQESHDTGKGIPQAARAMRRAGYEHSQQWAERIARTETIRASNAASLATAKLGTDLGYKVWMANIDLRTRKTHISANDQTVPINDRFVVGGALMDYPGDPSGPAEEVISCRCTLGYSDTPNLNLIADAGALAGAASTLTPDLGGSSMAVAEPVAPEAATGAAWSGIIAQEGVDTGDGRRIEPGAVAWRELPLPLMAQLTDAHGGADPGPTVLAGRIDSISRDGEDIVATGVFDTGENGAEAQRLVTDGMLRGISIDMAVNEAEFIPDEELPEDDLLGQLFAPGTLSITSGTILGATLVGFPAFENASIAIVAGAAMQLRHARSEGGHVVVTFAMPFAPTPPTPPKPGPPKPPPAAAPPNLDDAMTAVENAVGKLRDAIDATGD